MWPHIRLLPEASGETFKWKNKITFPPLLSAVSLYYDTISISRSTRRDKSQGSHTRLLKVSLSAVAAAAGEVIFSPDKFRVHVTSTEELFHIRRRE